MLAWWLSVKDWSSEVILTTFKKYYILILSNNICVVVVLVTKSCLTLFVTPWTVARPPLSMGFSRQEYWSGLPFSPSRDLPNLGMDPESPTLWADWFSSVAQSCQTLCSPMNCSTSDVLSITDYRSLLKLISIKSVMPSNHPILCRSPSLPSFSLSQYQGLFQWVSFTSGGQTIGASASTSVLPMNIQDWSPLGWTGLISLQYKGLSRVFSSTTVQKHQFFGAQLSL